METFRGSILRPRVPLSTLRRRPLDRPRITRGHRDWLGLRRTELASATTCRSPGARRGFDDSSSPSPKSGSNQVGSVSRSNANGQRGSGNRARALAGGMPATSVGATVSPGCRFKSGACNHLYRNSWRGLGRRDIGSGSSWPSHRYLVRIDHALPLAGHL
jgi:hypothetical protein